MTLTMDKEDGGGADAGETRRFLPSAWRERGKERRNTHETGRNLPFEPVTWYTCIECIVQQRRGGHKPCPPLCNTGQRKGILSSIHPTHNNRLHSLVLWEDNETGKKDSSQMVTRVSWRRDLYWQTRLLSGYKSSRHSSSTSPKKNNSIEAVKQRKIFSLSFC